MRRRRYLEASGVAIGAGLAGCLGSDDGSNGDEPDGNESEGGENGTDSVGFDEAFDGDYGSVATWLPAPSVLDVDPYRVNSMVPAALAEMSDYLEDGTLESITAIFDELAVDTLEPGAIDRLVVARYGDVTSPNAPSSLVLEGAVDPAAADTMLEEGGYERVRSDEGYDYYDGEDAAYALADGVLIASLGTGTLEIVEGIVDAEEGRVRRYGDENEGIERLAERLPMGHIAFAGPNTDTTGETPIGRSVADGSVMQVVGERTREGVVLVFEDGTTLDEDDVETLLDETESLRSLSNVRHEIEGPVLRIHGSRPTDEANF